MFRGGFRAEASQSRSGGGRRFGNALQVVLLLTFVACGGSETRDVTGPGTDTTGNGNVQRAMLTVTVGLAPGAQSVGSALGWGGVVPGASVQIQRQGSSGVVSAVTDAQGTVSFSGLLPGGYSVTAGRALNPSEKGILATAGVEADALGGGLGFTVTAPSSAVTVPASAGVRGSLVLSELSYSYIRDPAAGDYSAGQFFEIYNNSDTTIFLDGKTVFKGLRGWWHYPVEDFDCDYYNPFNYDPLGIWSQRIYRFPGAGTDYPLAPGEVAVLATDAIDHAAIVTGGPNLTNADFEFRGATDVDNPSVPDMLSIGAADGGLSGHGLILFNTREVLALAEYVDPAALPAAQIFATGIPHHRIPKALLLDVVTLRQNSVEQYAPCGPSSVHPTFDQHDAKLISRYDPNTAQRRVLLVGPGGRKVLQRTGTSSVDFFAGSPTPGSLPEP